MYAIVKSGGKQHRVTKGDVITVEKLDNNSGDKVAFEPVLAVNGDNITTTGSELAKIKVLGEVLTHTKGPKIKIHKFKNKTGYHKRQGHRQSLSVVKITDISGF